MVEEPRGTVLGPEETLWILECDVTGEAVWVVAGNFKDRLKAFDASTLSVSTLRLSVRAFVYASGASFQLWWTDGHSARSPCEGKCTHEEVYRGEVC